MPQAIICLMGPTASGKTALAIELAQQGNFEIISVDSAQIYKNMDIGTAKPDIATFKLAPHRLLDFVDPADNYSVAQFCQDVTREIDEVKAKGNIPLLVGGTMMYFNALQQGLAVLPESDPAVRQELAQQDMVALYKKLEQVDPNAAQRIHPNDQQRIIRALEVYVISGKSISTLQQETQRKTKYDFINFALMPADRTRLHKNIAQRFDTMLSDGLIAETKKLYQRKDMSADKPSMKSVGYRQVWQHLSGTLSYDEMRERSIIATRQLAKRQLTWLKSWQDLHIIKNAEQIQAKI